MKLTFWNLITAEISALTSRSSTYELLLTEVVRVFDTETVDDTEKKYIIDIIKAVMEANRTDSLISEETFAKQPESPSEDLNTLESNFTDLTTGITELLVKTKESLDQLTLDSTNTVQ